MVNTLYDKFGGVEFVGVAVDITNPLKEYKQRSIDVGADYLFDKSRDMKNILSVIKML